MFASAICDTSEARIIGPSNTMSHDPALLKSLAPFAGLDGPALETLARVSVVRQHDDGEILMLEGDDDAPALFVLAGAVRVYRTNLEGREQTLIVLRPGEGLNLPAAFADAPLAPCSACALGPTRVLTIALADLREAVRRWPGIALALLRHLSNRLQHLTGLTYDLSLLSVRARLARFLLAQSREPEEPPIRWTHAQIAARIGTVRVVVSRALSALADEGLIRLNRQRIEITDPDALEQLAEE